MKTPPPFRVGQGYDSHALVPGRPLIIGGVTIPHRAGLMGHSDADVLLHAITDALFGAAGLGDIGRHFPDTDASYAVPTPACCCERPDRSCTRQVLKLAISMRR
jgi:2-C-methyl-D-erythritol 2,4-cyclodiphosphate synthase